MSEIGQSPFQSYVRNLDSQIEPLSLGKNTPSYCMMATIFSLGKFFEETF